MDNMHLLVPTENGRHEKQKMDDEVCVIMCTLLVTPKHIMMTPMFILLPVSMTSNLEWKTRISQSKFSQMCWSNGQITLSDTGCEALYDVFIFPRNNMQTCLHIYWLAELRCFKPFVTCHLATDVCFPSTLLSPCKLWHEPEVLNAAFVCRVSAKITWNHCWVLRDQTALESSGARLNT